MGMKKAERPRRGTRSGLSRRPISERGRRERRKNIQAASSWIAIPAACRAAETAVSGSTQSVQSQAVEGVSNLRHRRGASRRSAGDAVVSEPSAPAWQRPGVIRRAAPRLPALWQSGCDGNDASITAFLRRWQSGTGVNRRKHKLPLALHGPPCVLAVGSRGQWRKYNCLVIPDIPRKAGYRQIQHRIPYARQCIGGSTPRSPYA